MSKEKHTIVFKIIILFIVHFINFKARIFQEYDGIEKNLKKYIL